MATRMQQRRGTASQWTASNPILNVGEIGFESDNNKFKIGDGTNHWADLPYFLDEDTIATNAGAYLEDSLLGAANGVAQLNASGKLVSTQIPNVDEITQDAINTALTAGTGITKTYDDNANTITVAVDTTAIQAKVANVTDTEIGYLDGVTSSIQTQLNNSVLSSAIGYSVASLDNNRKLPIAELTANVAFMSDVSAQGASTLSTASSYADTAVSTHNSDTTSVHGITDTATLLTESNSKTVTNKSVSLATNTLTGTIAEFNTALTDQNFATVAGSETLTNKTLTSPKINEDVAVTATATELNYVDGVTSAIQTQLNDKAPLASPTFTGTVAGVTKAHVGLGNVDNTADADKPVSTATQTALDAKLASATAATTYAPLSAPALTGNATAVNLTISGDLTVNGTTTNLNSTSLVIEDKNIVLGDTATPTDTTADGGGITLKGATDKTFNWVDATDAWTSSEHINLASGKAIYLNGTLETAAVQTLTNKTLTSPKINEDVVMSATSTELNILDGATLSTTELNYVDGVTSAIQTQLNAKENSTYAFVDESGTSRTLVASTDKTNTIKFTSSSAITLTVPNDSADGANWATGTFTDVFQYGSGQITVAGAAGVTIRSTDSQLKTRVRYSTVTLIKLGANEWLLVGDTAA